MTYNAQTSEETSNIIDRVWKDVQARSIDADRQAIPALRDWLLSQPNPHAVLLGGRTPAGAADERSARELEALLLARVALPKRAELTTPID